MQVYLVHKHSIDRGSFCVVFFLCCGGIDFITAIIVVLGVWYRAHMPGDFVNHRKSRVSICVVRSTTLYVRLMENNRSLRLAHAVCLPTLIS